MKKLLSLTLLSALLLAATGCVIEEGRSHHRRSGYHDNGRHAGHSYYRHDHRVYHHGYNDGYDDRDSRVYVGPRSHRSDVRVSF